MRKTPPERKTPAETPKTDQAKPTKREARARRSFSEEFKQDAVRLMRERRRAGVTLAAISRDLDVDPSSLWEWAQRLDGRGTGRVEGRSAPTPDETLQEEVRRLRREVAILRQEADFAKKAAAFFAKESL
jgi:transposase